MKGKILVVGQFPPPFHGSNVMAKLTVTTLEREGYQVIFIDKSFAKSIDTIGRPSLRKIIRIPVLHLSLLFLRT